MFQIFTNPTLVNWASPLEKTDAQIPDISGGTQISRSEINQQVTIMLQYSAILSMVSAPTTDTIHTYRLS